MFLNIVMLAGLSAMVLPVVLHLVSRAKFRRVEWGAMMFLESPAGELIDRSRWAQYGLLLMRMLAIASIALAFARPVSRRTVATGNPEQLAVVVVIDASPSMLYPEPAGTRFELARRAALGVVSQLQRGDQVALVVLGRAADQDIPLTSDLQDVASRLTALETASGVADQADGVRRAQAILTASDTPGEIFLIGDRQQSAWRQIASIQPDISDQRRIVAIPVGSTDHANAWIQNISLVGTPAIAGQTAQIELRIRNDGGVDRSNLKISLMDHDRLIDSRQIHLPAGTTEVVRMPIRINRAGDMLITATIDPSGIPADDNAMLALDVSEPVRGVVITGESPATVARSPTEDFSSNTDYLSLALQPFTTSRQKGDDPFRIRLFSSENWPALTPMRDRFVVLSGIKNLDLQQVRALEQFVFSGGGLLLVPGPGTEIEAWNRLLHSDGQGLAPAAIKSFHTADPPQALGTIDTSHDIFRFYSPHSTGVPKISILRYTAFSETSARNVVATLENGDPLILQRTFGRGRVVILGIPLDPDWSDFPRTPFYLPTMQSIGWWLAAIDSTWRNIASGSPIEYSFDSPNDRLATVQRQDGRSDRVPISTAGGVGMLIYPDTALPGRYTIRTAGRMQKDFVVKPTDVESILDPLDDASIKTILDAASVQRVRTDQLESVVGQIRQATEFSPVLLAIGLILLGGELLFAQRSIPQPGVEV